MLFFKGSIYHHSWKDTYQKQLHGELDGVAVEGNADALVNSQSHHSSEEQQDAGGVGFGESYAVVNYVLKEEDIAELSLGVSRLLESNKWAFFPN